LGNQKGRGHFGDLGGAGRIMLKLILRTYDVRLWTVYLTQNNDQWWALVKAVLNLWITQKAGNFLPSSATKKNDYKLHI
jgi:hypothetical protein